MKYAAFTFDDGRSDNDSLVKHIMESYRFRGTVYITTGFIDGTWVEKDVLRSPSEPLTVDEIKALYDSGWEIGLHGDKHQTTVADMRSALEKLQQWGIQNDSWGISIPNSRVSENEINALFESDYGEKNRIYPTRTGVRHRKTQKQSALWVVFRFEIQMGVSPLQCGECFFVWRRQPHKYSERRRKIDEYGRADCRFCARTAGQHGGGVDVTQHSCGRASAVRQGSLELGQSEF